MSSTEARERICAALALDLVGPTPEDRELAREVLPKAPSRWYLTGFLVPERARAAEELAEEEDLEDGAGEHPADDDDPPIERQAARVRLLPASIGLSCLLRAATERVRVRLFWGTYRPLQGVPEAEVAPHPTGDEAAVATSDSAPPAVETVLVEGSGEAEAAEGEQAWERVPFVWEGELELVGEEGTISPSPGVELRWLCRPTSCGDQPARLLSLFLTNRQQPSHPRDLAYLFQPVIEVESDALLGRPDPRRPPEEDLDARINALHYRDVVEWAVGHGIAAEPVCAPDRGVRRVRTSWMPKVEVARVVPRADLPGEFVAERLGALAREKVEEALVPLARAYRNWLAEQRERIVTLPEEHRATAQRLVEAGERAAARIEAGIARLVRDAEALEAFQVANRAVDTAARRRRAIESKRDPAQEPGLVWRPFQLAFWLLNLEGLCDPHSGDRETVDLLFFPTGGGKTEAYLALAAFAMVYRRLRWGEPRGLGLSVLMRYTLRLLTLDQLLRAAAVVCALELERQANPTLLGRWPFEIGLWVGRAATPNRLGEPGDKDTTTAWFRVKRYVNDQTKQLPVPIASCPWCGTAFGKESFLFGRYELENDVQRFVIDQKGKPEDLRLRCTNPSCAFDGAAGYLPILTVDDPIYRRLPAFVIATVDKLAALPWEQRTGALFGRVGRFDPRAGFTPPAIEGQEGLVAPPDLVIQDELHLVSGPLGTMVGLYETALEVIASRREGEGMIRPKLVASTATVQRAAEQVRKLYGRARTELFPPPGIERSDSFFARVATAEEGGRRRYVAVAAPGLGAKRVFLRAVSTLLAAGAAARDTLGAQSADPYLTVLGYFNALRELGSARRIVEGEIVAAVERYGQRDRAGRRLLADRARIGEPLELTSRVSTAEVAEARRRLGTPFGAEGFVDVALATNMISVGLDIPRLGLMVVAGQPKSAAEYIQATSRVGRQPEKPGLVVVLLNLQKPRDRSHFEHFRYFHETFYRAVEAQSVTPFAVGALDRGLAAVVVAMARHLDPELWDEPDVQKIDELERFRPELAARLVERLSRCGAEEVRAELEARLERLLEAWKRIAARAEGLAYARPPKQGIERLLREVLEPVSDADWSLFRAPRSMREVEPASWLRPVKPDFRPLPGEEGGP